MERGYGNAITPRWNGYEMARGQRRELQYQGAATYRNKFQKVVGARWRSDKVPGRGSDKVPVRLTASGVVRARTAGEDRAVPPAEEQVVGGFQRNGCQRLVVKASS